MFAVLARLQGAVGDAMYAGRASSGVVNPSDVGSQALSSALEAASGGGSLGSSDSVFASKLIISPELVAREKVKAKQGYCETALWNCTDLCPCPTPASRARGSFFFVAPPRPPCPGPLRGPGVLAVPVCAGVRACGHLGVWACGHANVPQCRGAAVPRDLPQRRWAL